MKFEQLISIPDKYKDPLDVESGKVEKFYYKTKGPRGNDAEPYEKYCMVYTPYGYDPEKEYDIIYHCHGSGEVCDRAFIKGNEPTYKKYVFDNMIKDKVSRPFIWVSVEWYEENLKPSRGFNEEDFRRLNFNFHNELFNDIVKSVEAKYHTYAGFDVSDENLYKSRDHRALAGWSQGSVTTWFTMASEHGKYFSMFNTECAPISFDRIYGMDEIDSVKAVEMQKERMIAGGISKDDFKLYICIGGDEELTPKILEQMHELEKHSDYFIFDGDNKNTAYYVYPHGLHHTEWRRIYQFNALRSFFPVEEE